MAILKPFLINLIIGLLAISCTKEANSSLQNDIPTQDNQPTYTNNPQSIPSLKLTIEPRVTKGLQGDFTNVSFTIQSKPWTPIIKGKIDCTLAVDSKATCNLHQQLDKLEDGNPYRIIIFSQGSTKDAQNNDGLACDYFIYKKNEVPDLTISPTSSGECLLWQLKYDTGYDEPEIKNRVRHILNGEGTEDYDLEVTLYDLYRYYDSDYDWNEAWKKLVKLIQANKPLPKDNSSPIDGSGKLFSS